MAIQRFVAFEFTNAVLLIDAVWCAALCFFSFIFKTLQSFPVEFKSGDMREKFRLCSSSKALVWRLQVRILVMFGFSSSVFHLFILFSFSHLKMSSPLLHILHSCGHMSAHSHLRFTVCSLIQSWPGPCLVSYEERAANMHLAYFHGLWQILISQFCAVSDGFLLGCFP